MATFDRFGFKGNASILRPLDAGVKCKESDVIDIATDIARNRSITSLDLTGAAVSAEAAKALGTALGKNSTTLIQHLSVADCDMHADAIAVLAPLLAGNDRIEVLDLKGNPLRDDGAVAVAALLAGNQTLRTVDLTACKIGPAGARALGDALAQNTKLRTLNLSNNKLRAAGMTALAEGIKANASLRVLDVSGNSINAEGGMALAEVLRVNESLETVNLARNYLSDAVPRIGLALAGRPRPVRLVDLSTNRIDGSICRALAQILEGNRVTVACLSLEGNEIGDAGLVPLYHALKGTAIQFLDVSNAALTGHSGVVIADLIASCKQLNSVQVDGNALGDDAGVEIAVAFGRSPALTAVNFERTNIGSRTMHALCEAVAHNLNVRSLNLSENPAITEGDVLALLRELGAKSALEELDLANLDLPESEDLLRALVDLFVGNKKLQAVLLEHTTMGASIPQSIMTREVARALLSASGQDAVAACLDQTKLGTTSGADAHAAASRGPALMSVTGATNAQSRSLAVGLSKIEMSRNAETIFKPAWALTVPLDPPSHDADEAEDGAHPPLVPHPASLHHPLYPGYGVGQFSSGSLVQSLSNALPYTVANSLGQRRRFVPTADGASLLSAPPRQALKESPYSLHALENNPGQLPVTEDQLRRKFTELDVEGNGYLPTEEFKQLYMSFQSFGLPMTQQEADKAFASCGATRPKLPFDQFCILMLRLASR